MASSSQTNGIPDFDTNFHGRVHPLRPGPFRSGRRSGILHRSFARWASRAERTDAGVDAVILRHDEECSPSVFDPLATTAFDILPPSASYGYTGQRNVALMHGRTDFQRHEPAERSISLAPDLPAIPERLLLAHARGDVLFLCGAGVSKAAGLPDFEQLVRGVYRTLDPGIHEILPVTPIDPRCVPRPDCSSLTDRQTAEVRRFLSREFDVVLGMLERRLDSRTREDSQVRTRVNQLLRGSGGQREAPRRR